MPKHAAGFTETAEELKSIHPFNLVRRLQVCRNHGPRVAFLGLALFPLADQEIDPVGFARIVCFLASRNDREATVDALRASPAVRMLLGHLPRSGAACRVLEQFPAA